MMKTVASGILVLSSVVGSIVLPACGGDAPATSQTAAPATSSDAAPVDAPQAREATICEAQQSFDSRCGASGADAGGTCTISCFERLMTPAAAATFSACTANLACGGTTCALGSPCTDPELCILRTGKAGLAESGFDVDPVVAKCEAKQNECHLELEIICDADRFAAMYGPFAGVPAAIAACLDKECDEMRPCMQKANAEVSDCILASAGVE